MDKRRINFNNRGFTLIELVATIVVLSLVMAITAYSITTIMKKNKEELRNQLIVNIKNAAESYYQECKYANNEAINCNFSNNTLSTTLGDLVNNGYLTGNSKEENTQNYVLVDPITKANISNCIINIKSQNGKIYVDNVNATGECNFDFGGIDGERPEISSGSSNSALSGSTIVGGGTIDLPSNPNGTGA